MNLEWINDKTFRLRLAGGKPVLGNMDMFADVDDVGEVVQDNERSGREITSRLHVLDRLQTHPLFMFAECTSLVCPMSRCNSPFRRMFTDLVKYELTNKMDVSFVGLFSGCSVVDWDVMRTAGRVTTYKDVCGRHWYHEMIPYFPKDGGFVDYSTFPTVEEPERPQGYENPTSGIRFYSNMDSQPDPKAMQRFRVAHADYTRFEAFACTMVRWQAFLEWMTYFHGPDVCIEVYTEPDTYKPDEKDTIIALDLYDDVGFAADSPSMMRSFEGNLYHLSCLERATGATWDLAVSGYKNTEIDIFRLWLKFKAFETLPRFLSKIVI